MVYFTYSSFCCSLLGNNNFFGTMPPELHKLSMHSEIHVGENMLSGAANGASFNEIFSTRFGIFLMHFNIDAFICYIILFPLFFVNKRYF